MMKSDKMLYEADKPIVIDNIWQNGEPPKDGKTYYVRLLSPVRWKPYSPKSQEYKHGKKGRWQEMNEYGGWQNCGAVFADWTSKEAFDAALLSTKAKG